MRREVKVKKQTGKERDAKMERDRWKGEADRQTFGELKRKTDIDMARLTGGQTDKEMYRRTYIFV